MAQSYFSLVTTTGKIKLAQSAAGGSAVVITQFAIGDGNGAEVNPTAASPRWCARCGAPRWKAL